MTTMSNFYKNSSISYKKDLSVSLVLENLKAYNLATGNVPVADDEPRNVEGKESRRKRIRTQKSPRPSRLQREVEEDDRPMSHQDYVHKLRHCFYACKKLIGSTQSVLNLAAYGSDESNSSESDKEDPSLAGVTNEVEQIETRDEQRFPIAGQPFCVVCGRYGEYICNETDDDICGMECKTELLQRVQCAKVLCNSSSTVQFEDICGISLEDCLAASNDQVLARGSNSIPRDLCDLYRRCHQIGHNLSGANCSLCRSSLSLATCLDCNAVFCDDAGHLDEHIRMHPSHQQYYSHKLKRLVKCCKSTCKVRKMRDLLTCHYCFDKAFDKYYDMYTASWHRMNCTNADVEDKAYMLSRTAHKGKYVQLSDFIFQGAESQLMTRLNILPQKGWNVYREDNKTKVRKDEEAAAKEEQLKREQSRKKDTEFRLEQL
ncbi:DEAD-box ATP-dependent RNA helicase 41 [Linum perenne]